MYHRLQISKKLYKEDKELLKAKATFKAAVDSIPASALTPELSAALGRAVVSAGDTPASAPAPVSSQPTEPNGVQGMQHSSQRGF